MKGLNSSFRMKADFLFCSFKTFVSGFYCLVVNAQDCPKNIDFEAGTFQDWTCYVGFVIEQNNNNVIRLSPTTQPGYNRHTMITSSPANGLDPYGNFPINCPNGSGQSVKLGNELGGALAEGLGYEFTIPGNQDLFTLTYHYAVVFQEPPHLEHQQPRFEVEVMNVTRNEVLGCASFAFRPFGPLTPGFDTTYDLVNNVRVWFKDWTPISINLNGHAGETIRLTFKTADCTYFDHFSYAYIDVDTECNGEFTAAKYCPDDTLINLIAPPGYRNYIWHNNSFTQVLGTQQTLSVSPQAISGTSLPVEVFPYHGFGCIDTLYAKIGDTLTVDANAGPDLLSCNNDSVLIGTASVPGLSYSWGPSQGLSDPAVSSPLANPASPTNYILIASSSGGGCIVRDTVFVNKSFVNDSLQVFGSLNYCVGYGDPPIFSVRNADSIQWMRDDVMINGANRTEYEPVQSGTYYAVVYNGDGCRVPTSPKTVNIENRKQGINYPIAYAVANVPTNLEARDFGSIVLWKPTFNLSDPNIVSPLFTGNSDQSYTIEITTISGCITIDTQMVKIVSHPDIYVPTAFTPNQDGRNDILRPVLVGIKELRYFKIFNRWGQLVFETKTSGAGWDGKVKGVTTPIQVVVWMAEGLGWDNKVYLRKGTSTILR